MLKKNINIKEKNIIRLLIPQFAILSSFIHLQSRDITKQSSTNALENANCTQTKVNSKWFSISVLCGYDSLQALTLVTVESFLTVSKSAIAEDENKLKSKALPPSEAQKLDF